MLLLRISGRATVGADGIVVSCLGVETFVPFADVVRVERELLEDDEVHSEHVVPLRR